MTLKDKHPRMVSIVDLKGDDRTFRTRYLEGCPSLSPSVDTVGILQPLILRGGPGNYIIVSGFRRYRAAYQAGCDNVPAFIFSEDGLKPLDGIRLSVIQNMTQGDMNHMEKALVLKKVVEWGIAPTRIRSLMKDLHIQDSEKLLKQYLSLDNMVYELRCKAGRKGLNLRTCVKLARLDSRDQMALAPLLDTYKLSVGTLNRYLEIMEEITKRDGCRLFELLEGLKGIRRKEDFINAVMKRRYPMLFSYKKPLEDNLKEIEREIGANVYITLSLEEGYLKVTVCAGGDEELYSKIDRIHRITEKGRFKEIFRLILDSKPRPISVRFENSMPSHRVKSKM